MCAVCGPPKQLQQLHQRQLIMDHHNKYNQNEITLQYCENYQNGTQRCGVSKCCWKNAANKPIQCRVATNLQFIKNAILEVQKKKDVCLYFFGQNWATWFPRIQSQESRHGEGQLRWNQDSQLTAPAFLPRILHNGLVLNYKLLYY